MRIALIYNRSAGGRTYAEDDIVRLLRDDGHDVAVFGKRREDVARALEQKPAVLVAAGGDRTVATAAIGLCEHASEVPLYMLPLGTSNNVARTLGVGVRDTTPALIAKLASAHPVRLDIGLAVAESGETSFVEAAGVGFLGTRLHRARSLRERIDRFARRLRRRPLEGEALVRVAASGFARAIRRCPVRDYTVIADGEDISGEYLAVEAMNIRSIGPRLPLAPDANPGDGLLDLVLVRPGDREPLARIAEEFGGHEAACCACRRVREAELSWPAGNGHADDEPWPFPANRARPSRESRVHVRVRGAVQVLVPSGTSTRTS